MARAVNHLPTHLTGVEFFAATQLAIHAEHKTVLKKELAFSQGSRLSQRLIVYFSGYDLTVFVLFY